MKYSPGHAAVALVGNKWSTMVLPAVAKRSGVLPTPAVAEEDGKAPALRARQEVTVEMPPVRVAQLGTPTAVTPSSPEQNIDPAQARARALVTTLAETRRVEGATSPLYRAQLEQVYSAIARNPEQSLRNIIIAGAAAGPTNPDVSAVVGELLALTPGMDGRPDLRAHLTRVARDLEIPPARSPAELVDNVRRYVAGTPAAPAAQPIAAATPLGSVQSIVDDASRLPVGPAGDTQAKTVGQQLAQLRANGSGEGSDYDRAARGIIDSMRVPGQRTATPENLQRFARLVASGDPAVAADLWRRFGPDEATTRALGVQLARLPGRDSALGADGRPVGALNTLPPDVLRSVSASLSARPFAELSQPEREAALAARVSEFARSREPGFNGDLAADMELAFGNGPRSFSQMQRDYVGGANDGGWAAAMLEPMRERVQQEALERLRQRSGDIMQRTQRGGASPDEALLREHEQLMRAYKLADGPNVNPRTVERLRQLRDGYMSGLTSLPADQFGKVYERISRHVNPSDMLDFARRFTAGGLTPENARRLARLPNRFVNDMFGALRETLNNPGMAANPADLDAAVALRMQTVRARVSETQRLPWAADTLDQSLADMRFLHGLPTGDRVDDAIARRYLEMADPERKRLQEAAIARVSRTLFPRQNRDAALRRVRAAIDGIPNAATAPIRERLAGAADWSVRLSSLDASRAPSVELPARGGTFTTYKPYRFGTARSIETIKRIAEQFYERTGLVLRVGDIAARGGGTIPDHRSHTSGNIFDLDMAFSDGRTDVEPERNSRNATWHSPAYDRLATKELVNIIREMFPNAPASAILFNDDSIKGVMAYPNHDNHLHIQRLF